MEYNLKEIDGACNLNAAWISRKVDLKIGKVHIFFIKDPRL